MKLVTNNLHTQVSLWCFDALGTGVQSWVGLELADKDGIVVKKGHQSADFLSVCLSVFVLKFPNVVALNAVWCRKGQKSASVCQSEQTQVCKRALEGAQRAP